MSPDEWRMCFFVFAFLVGFLILMAGIGVIIHLALKKLVYCQPRKPNADPITNFPPPPRAMSMSLRVQEMLGDSLTQFGFLILCLGMIVVWQFVFDADLTSWYSFRSGVESSIGRVVTCSKKTEIPQRYGSGTPVYANAYVFRAPDGAEISGNSYATGVCLPEGLAIAVEWPAGHPERSRIRGMRAKVWPTSFGLFLASVPVAGLILIQVGVLSGLKIVRLLAGGRLARGKLVEKRQTDGHTDDGRPIFEMVFSFVDDTGRERRVSTMAHEPELLEAEAAKNLLYDPADPAQAVMLNILPGLARVGPTGRLEPRNSLNTVRVLVLPALTFLGHGLYLFLRFR